MALGLDARDYLERSDAHTFFARLGDAIEIGPTGNNLRDLRIGVAASFQLLDEIPVATHDQSMHLVATERELIAVSEESGVGLH